MQLILGLFAPDSGTIRLGDIDISGHVPSELAKWIRYVPPQPLVVRGSAKFNLELSPRSFGNMEGGLNF